MRTYKEHGVDLSGSKVVVAIVQIAGPLPNGMHKTVINDRETLGWRSVAEMAARVKKATSILDQLNSIPLRPNVVVFPEYSLPVKMSLPELQRKSDAYGFI